MTTTELLTKPELTPALEAFFETQKDYSQALGACGWSMSFESFYSTWHNDNAAEKIKTNWEKLNERAIQIEQAVILGCRLEDFVNAGFDILGAEYTTALYRYQEQQRDIADAPRRAWAAAYNARLAEIDKQLKGAKIRRGKLWTQLNAGKINSEQHGAMWHAISGEIEALEARREIAAAERFESVAA